MTAVTEDYDAVWRMLKARRVAVVGASQDPTKFSGVLVPSILSGGFTGEVFPVNPRADVVAGLKAYPSVSEIPGTLDLVVIAVPARFVPAILHEDGRQGCGRRRRHQRRGSRVRQAGVRQGDPRDRARPRAATLRPQHPGVRLRPQPALGRLLAGRHRARPAGGGGAERHRGGRPHRLGAGRRPRRECFHQPRQPGRHLRVGRGATDGGGRAHGGHRSVPRGPRRRSTLRRRPQGRGDAEAARGARSAAAPQRGRAAVASHTGSLAGSDRVFTGVCRQFGVVRAEDSEGLYDAAKILACMPLPAGRRVLVVSSSGGSCALAADAGDANGLVPAGPA